MATEYIRKWQNYDKRYRLYDVVNGVKATYYGSFTKMVGGDMTIDTFAYNVIDPNYNVTTKFIPGQTSFAPVHLECEMGDVVVALYDWFVQAIDGDVKDLRKNCSIDLYTTGDTATIVTWNLINAIPVVLPGFSYHAYQKTESAKFKIKLQAEYIEIVFPSA